MSNLFKSSVVWQFAGGFALGAIGLVAFHAPVSAAPKVTPAAAVAK